MAGKKRQRIPLVKATASEILAAYDIEVPPEVQRASDRAMAKVRRIAAARDARKRSTKSRTAAAK